MSALEIVGIVWAVLAALYLGLFLYRSVVGMKEEDTLYLSEGESRLAQEQKEIMKNIDKLDSVTHKTGWAALAMTVVVAGMWVYSVVRNLF